LSCASFPYRPILPYFQLSFRKQRVEPGNLPFNSPYFAVVYQLLGLKAETKVEKFLVGFFQLLFQFLGAEIPEFL
jgi:hypothetical protein